MSENSTLKTFTPCSGKLNGTIILQKNAPTATTKDVSESLIILQNTETALKYAYGDIFTFDTSTSKVKPFDCSYNFGDEKNEDPTISTLGVRASVSDSLSNAKSLFDTYGFREGLRNFSRELFIPQGLSSLTISNPNINPSQILSMKINGQDGSYYLLNAHVEFILFEQYDCFDHIYSR